LEIINCSSNAFSIHIAHVATTVCNSQRCLPIYTARYEKEVNQFHAFINHYHTLYDGIKRNDMQHNGI